ncbi:MAG: hypothetical protein KF696_09990 [Planctomycetes bacterium]|nr:hypothetical protein [Planctomycetota bacterium]MCW8136188.1 hypothetical protein [Planctomycetota bacterium]
MLAETGGVLGFFAGAAILLMTIPLATMGGGIGLLLGWPIIGFLLAPFIKVASANDDDEDEDE